LIGGILEALGNITAEKVNRKAKDRKLSLPSMTRGNLGMKEYIYIYIYIEREIR
jgi:hypothetical protein